MTTSDQIARVVAAARAWKWHRDNKVAHYQEGAERELASALAELDREEQQPADTTGEKSDPLPPHTFLKGSQ